MGKHPLHPLVAVLRPLVAVIVDVGVKRRWNRADRRDSFEQVRIDQRAMLDAEARMGNGTFARVGSLEQFIRIQHHINCHVAVGVDADLKAMLVRVPHRVVQPGW